MPYPRTSAYQAMAIREPSPKHSTWVPEAVHARYTIGTGAVLDGATFASPAQRGGLFAFQKQRGSFPSEKTRQPTCNGQTDVSLRRAVPRALQPPEWRSRSNGLRNHPVLPNPEFQPARVRSQGPRPYPYPARIPILSTLSSSDPVSYT